MCALHLTHPRAHTPGAVDTHKPGAVDTTHLEQWTHTWSTDTHNTHTPGAVDTPHTHTHTHTTHTHTHTHTHTTHTHTHTHTHTWSSANTHTHLEQSTLRARGAVGGSVPCSRVSPQSWTIPAGAENPQPQITSPALYPLGHGCTSIITYSYTVLLHIQCGSVKSNAILIKIHKHIKSYSIASEIPSNVRFFSEI